MLTLELVRKGAWSALTHPRWTLHKHDKCYRVQKCKVKGLYLASHLRFIEGDEMFLKHGNDISDGAVLLM